MNLDGRSVLLTGATGGIGQAIARALAARGARLVLTGRRAEVLEPLAAEVGGRAVACDLASADEVTRLLGECSNADVLVANAALPASGVLESFSVEEIDRALDVNLRAPIVLARALSQGHGRARARPPRLRLLAVGQGGERARLDLLGDQVRAARVRARAAGGPARHAASASRPSSPGFISDAGMFHESGAKLPGYVAMKTPEDVAAAVVRAIERNRAEIDVAPLPLRLGTAVAGLLPELSGRVQRRLGSLEIAESMAEGQRDKR